MLKQSQGALDDDVLKDGSGRNVNGAAFSGDNDDSALKCDAPTQVDSSGDGQMVELDDLGDTTDALLEVRDLLEVVTKLDEGSWAETVGVDLELAVLQRVQVRLDKHQVGAGLDWQESSSRNVNTVSVVEMTDSSTDSGLELDDGDI